MKKLNLTSSDFRRILLSAKTILAATLAVGLTAGAGSAATLNVVAGQLNGASGVDVGGILYDVEFRDGTCIALFNGCNDASDFTFTTQTAATLAANALIDQVVIDGPAGQFNLDPELTRGILSSGFGSIWMPYELSPPFSVTAVTIRNQAGSFPMPLGSETIGDWYNMSSSGNATYAVWQVQSSPPVSAVPLPAGGLLLLSGFGGFAAVSRRKKRAA